MSLLEEASRVRKKVRQVAKSKLDLEITPNMRIGVAVYIKTKIVPLPTLKRKDSVRQGPVRLDRTYVLQDDPETVVEDKQIALRYGSEYVLVPPDRINELKLEDQSKCLRVLGFFDKDLFGFHRLISGCDCVAAEPGNAHAAIALSSLIHGLIEENKVALCRFSAREGSEPKLVVLFPHAQSEFECFYAVQAPFSEDSREPTLLFPSLPEPRQELVHAVDEYISSMLLPEAVFLPEHTVNPTIHRFWKTVEARAKMGPDASVPPLEAEAYELMHPEHRVGNTKRVATAIDAMLKIRPLVENVSESVEEKKRRRFWREINADEANLVKSPTKIDVKRIRVEDMQHEGSTQAESQKSDSIENTVRESIDRSDIKEAIRQIESFRHTCVEKQTAIEFNTLFRKLLDAAESHPRLWRELIVKGVSLISTDEVPKAVKPEEATKFIEDVMKIV